MSYPLFFPIQYSDVNLVIHYLLLKHYLINKIADPENNSQVVHSEYCEMLPKPEKLRYIGMFKTFQEAMIDAQQEYKKPVPCQYCCHNK